MIKTRKRKKEINWQTKFENRTGTGNDWDLCTLGSMLHHELMNALTLRTQDEEYGPDYRDLSRFSCDMAVAFLSELRESYEAGTPWRPTPGSLFLKADKQPWDLGTELRQWVDIHAFQLPSSWIALEIPSGIPVCLRKPVIYRILRILTDNAGQALDMVERNNKRCIIRSDLEDDALVLEVLDNGAPWGTVKTGTSQIGLDLVRRYTQACGGKLEVNIPHGEFKIVRVRLRGAVRKGGQGDA